MNPVERLLRKADGTQQKYHPSAFVLGVVKKYGDDNGGVLVANLTYSAFVSFFPLLLVLVTVLGLLAAGDPGFRADAVDAVASQVPLIGHQLTENVHQLRKSSVIGLIVGLATLVWGATGLAQAGLFTMEQVGPGQPGAAGAGESAPGGRAGRRHVHRPRAGHARRGQDTADPRRDLPARAAPARTGPARPAPAAAAPAGAKPA